MCNLNCVYCEQRARLRLSVVTALETLKWPSRGNLEQRLFSTLSFLWQWHRCANIFIYHIRYSLYFTLLEQSYSRTPKVWSRSKIKIIARDLDQKSKRSKIIYIDLDQLKIKDQGHWYWYLIFDLDLFPQKDPRSRSYFRKKCTKYDQIQCFPSKTAQIWPDSG